MKYIDYFIPPSFQRSSDAFYQARMLVAVIFGYIMVMAAFLMFYGLNSTFAEEERKMILSLVAFITPCLFGILYLVKAHGLLELCGHSIVIVTCICTVIIVYYSGGPVVAPVNLLAIVAAFLSFCFLGLRWGLIWSGIIFTSLGLGMMASLNGYEFPQLANPETIHLSRTFSVLIVFAIIVYLASVYEVMNIFLRKERDEEKDRYKNIANIAVEGSVVSETADSLAQAGDNVLSSTNKQKVALEELSTTAEQLGATADQNSNLAKNAMLSIQNTENHLAVSEQDISELAAAMSDVSSLSDEIQSINNVINEISHQTNMLSLNAMIEASRSGNENGGFKVVAVEVKKLAERSAQAADSINDLLSRNQDSVEKGVTISDTIKKRFAEISEQVLPLVKDIQNVSDASNEQNEAIRQIMEGLSHIDKAVEYNVNLAEESSKLATELRANSTKLSEMLNSI